jgi:hypothetical protein
MLKLITKVQRLRALFRDLERVPPGLERFEKLVFTAPLSPVDRHVSMYMATRYDAFFDTIYIRWTTARINKLLDLYGVDFFKNKKIAEFGSGLSDVGAFFADLGADVLCLEGREETVRFAKLRHRNVLGLRIQQFDLEEDFTSLGHFDILIHFGLLYHLPNVEEHLNQCFSIADEVVLESVVCDSDDPEKLVLVSERSEVLVEAMHGKGSRPSPAYIERVAGKNGFSIIYIGLKYRQRLCL